MGIWKNWLWAALLAGAAPASAQAPGAAGSPPLTAQPRFPLPRSGEIRVPRSPSAIPVLTNPDGRPTLLVRDWLKELEQTAIPAGPTVSSGDLIEAAALLGAGCARDNRTFRCREARALESVGVAMRSAARAFGDCDLAAARFREIYSDDVEDIGEVDLDLRRDFDRACLGSFAPRVGENAAAIAAERPALLEGGDRDGGIVGLIGLLEADGAVICAGLMKPERVFITARHCLRGLDRATLKVRSAARAFPPLAVYSQQHPAWSKLGVAADWAALTLEDGPPLAIPPSRLAVLDLPRDVTLVGYYRYADPAIYAPGNAAVERDLRYPKRGLCQAVETLSDCLQIACQTVRGFSGSPILGARDPDGAVEVLGFLSSDIGNNTGCTMTSDIRYSSFAVSAGAITGQ